MKDLFKTILFWALLVTLFFYFYTAGISESAGFKKLKVESKRSGNGFVIRMKPEGWEVWTVEKKVETAKFFPPQSKLATSSEATVGSKTAPSTVKPA